MLIQENVDQIFEESEVWERDPAAKAQGLNRVVFLIAQRRGEVRGQEPRLLDGVFAAWAICLPFFPQPESYTELMYARRAEWFEGVSDKQRDQRAIRFFSDDLLQLDLNELAEIVATGDAVQRIEGYLGVLAEDATKEAELGDHYPAAKVVKTTTFGAFVELVKGTDGLLHISNVKPGERVDSVDDVLSAGDEIDVTVVEVDRERGRIGLRLSDDPSVAGKSAEELAAAGSGSGTGAEGRDAQERHRARREKREDRQERRHQ
jgi:predicted RNA-binding protein with RPS1 domain